MLCLYTHNMQSVAWPALFTEPITAKWKRLQTGDVKEMKKKLVTS